MGFHSRGAREVFTTVISTPGFPRGRSPSKIPSPAPALYSLLLREGGAHQRAGYPCPFPAAPSRCALGPRASELLAARCSPWRPCSRKPAVTQPSTTRSDSSFTRDKMLMFGSHHVRLVCLPRGFKPRPAQQHCMI